MGSRPRPQRHNGGFEGICCVSLGRHGVSRPVRSLGRGNQLRLIVRTTQTYGATAPRRSKKLQQFFACCRRDRSDDTHVYDHRPVLLVAVTHCPTYFLKSLVLGWPVPDIIHRYVQMETQLYETGGEVEPGRQIGPETSNFGRRGHRGLAC